MTSDFIDKMSNPSYGLLVNEEYTLQFARLFSEEGFDNRLKSEITVKPYHFLDIANVDI